MPITILDRLYIYLRKLIAAYNEFLYSINVTPVPSRIPCQHYLAAAPRCHAGISPDQDFYQSGTGAFWGEVKRSNVSSTGIVIMISYIDKPVKLEAYICKIYVYVQQK